MSNYFISLLRRVYSKMKEFASVGSKFFLFEVNSFVRRDLMCKKANMISQKLPPSLPPHVNNSGKSTLRIHLLTCTEVNPTPAGPGYVLPLQTV